MEARVLTLKACVSHFSEIVTLSIVSKQLVTNTVLGEFLSKRPGAKKVEAFMAKQLQLRIDQMALDSKIQSKLPFKLTI